MKIKCCDALLNNCVSAATRPQAAYYLSLLLVAIYFVLAVAKISLPGVYADEIFWANAALGGIDDSFIILKVYDIPVMLMSYIGALKAYLYYPIFKLFGVSVYSIRIPVIILTSLSLMLLRYVLKQLFNDKIALTTLLLLVVDASFVSQTREDMGPIVIELALKIVCLYLLTRFIATIELKYLLYLDCALFLGVFNKLNFIWFVNALLFSAALVYFNDVKRAVRDKYSHGVFRCLAILAIGYTVQVGYFLVLNKLFKLYEPFNFAGIIERLEYVYTILLKKLITGENFYDSIYPSIHKPINDWFAYFIILLFVAGFINLLIFNKQSSFRYTKHYYFILLITFFSLLQIVFTGRATANWHMFTIYPFVAILLGVYIVTITARINSGGRRLLIATVVLVIIVSYQARMNYLYLQAYDTTPENINWSRAIYELIAYSADSRDKFISVDWGTHIQLLAFTGKKDKYIDLSYWLNDVNVENSMRERVNSILAHSRLFTWIVNTNKRPLYSSEWLNDSGSVVRKKWLTTEAFKPGGAYAFILHPEGETTFPAARENFFALAKLSGIKMELVTTIRDGTKPVYEIYRPMTAQ